MTLDNLTITIHMASTALQPIQRLQAWLEELRDMGVDVTVDGPSPGDLDRQLEGIVKDLDAYVVAHPEADVTSERARIEAIRQVNAFLRDYGRPTAP